MIARNTPLRRRARIRPENPVRRARSRARQFGPPGFVDWSHTQPCLVCGEAPPTEVAHVRSRGAGGTWTQTVAMCRRCHRASHDVGVRTFEAAAGVNLTRLAREHHQRWLQVAPWWGA
jgi:hypothetical protein